jgi:hypothetical protein
MSRNLNMQVEHTYLQTKAYSTSSTKCYQKRIPYASKKRFTNTLLNKFNIYLVKYILGKDGRKHFFLTFVHNKVPNRKKGNSHKHHTSILSPRKITKEQIRTIS